MSRKVLSILLLGFSSGLPLALTAATLQAWLVKEGLSLEKIGLFSLVGTPYAWKFIWAPFLDRYAVPILGRRRGWILVTQIALACCIIALAFSNPRNWIWGMVIASMGVAFFSASQDIVFDAYKTDVVTEKERGLIASFGTIGYRCAMLVSGTLAPILADQLTNSILDPGNGGFLKTSGIVPAIKNLLGIVGTPDAVTASEISFKVVYLLMGCLAFCGIFATLLAPEPKTPAKPPKTLQEAAVRPFLQFIGRKRSWEILLFLTFYRLDVILATALLTPFLVKALGFSLTDVGVVSKGVGLVSLLAGIAFGGALMGRIGLRRSLWIFGIAQGGSTAAFMWLAHVGHVYSVMATAIALENFCSGMGTAAFTAFLMSQCDARYTATQYALLTSLMGLARVAGQAPAGYLVEALGWQSYFLLSIFAAVPGLLLLLRYSKWEIQNGEGGTPLTESALSK
jgi:PAT family beta-lactamase induction signal transducer AmpG